MRRGIFSLELLLVLPLFMLVLAAIVEFSLLYEARSRLVEAGRLAAREASLPGSNLNRVMQIAQQALPPTMHAPLQVHAEFGQYSGDIVTVVLTLPMEATAPDLLWPIGVSLRQHRFVVETSMVKE